MIIVKKSDDRHSIVLIFTYVKVLNNKYEIIAVAHSKGYEQNKFHELHDNFQILYVFNKICFLSRFV